MQLGYTDKLASSYIQVNIMFRPKAMDVSGSFVLWKKGAEFGFGDELMYWCPAHGCMGFHSMSFELTEQELERLGDQDDISKWPADLKLKHDNWYQTKVVCPECGVVCGRNELVDTYFFKTPVTRVAILMSKIWGSLGGDADVYMVRTKESKAFKDAMAMLKSNMFDKKAYDTLLSRGRDRDQVFYKLADIMRDTNAGKSVTSCFEGLLRS